MTVKRQVREFYSHWLPPKLGAIAVTIGHNIFYKESENKITVKLRHHEMIHVEQCERYTTVGFFIIYFYHYFAARLKGLDHWKAYRANPMEIEAYTREREVR